jgi:acyl-CoA synthetase (AMP-forming)/AMP-acid ligase II
MTGIDTTTHTFTRSVSSMLRHWAAVQPDAPMLTQDGTTVTWGELYERAVRVAAALPSRWR